MGLSNKTGRRKGRAADRSTLRLILYALSAAIIVMALSGIRSFLSRRAFSEEILDESVQALRFMLENVNERTGSPEEALALLHEAVLDKAGGALNIALCVFNGDVPSVIASGSAEAGELELMLSGLNPGLEPDQSRSRLAWTARGPVLVGSYVFSIEGRLYGVATLDHFLHIYPGTSIAALLLAILGVVLTALLLQRSAAPFARAAREEHHRLFRLLDKIGICIRVLDPRDGSLLYANTEMQDRFGDLLSLPYDRLWEADSEESCVPDEHIVYHPGLDAYFRSTVSEIEWRDEPRAILEVYVDISPRMRAEKQLEIQAAVTAWSHDAIIATDMELNCIYANAMAYTMSGYTPEEIGLNLSPRHLFAPETAAMVEEGCRIALESGSWKGEHKLLRRDGSELEVEQMVITIWDSRGRPSGVCTIIRDMTALNETKRKLEETGRRLGIALAASGSGVFDIDLARGTAKYGADCARLFNMPFSDAGIPVRLFEKQLSGMVAGEPKPELIQTLIRWGSGASTREHSLRLTMPDGSLRVVSVYCTAMDEGNLSPGRIIGMAIDNTARWEMEERLRVSMKQAEAANEAKSRFLSNMSHEIRTPMNAIVGMTKIARSATDSEKVEACLEKVESSAAHLMNIINDVLDLSKIESGTFELSEEPFDLEATLADLVAVLRAKVEEKRQDLLVKIDSNIPGRLVGDAARFTQVIMNLMSNAVKFTAAQGSIGLSICLLESRGSRIVLEVTVADNGIGLSESQRGRIFKAFEQGDGSIAKRYGGTGLGLAISNRIVGMMNGRFAVRSTPGKGSSFSFTAEFRVAGDSMEVSVREVGKKTLRVLVADAGSERLDYMSGILKGHSIRHTAVRGGAEAVEAAQQGDTAGDPYHVALLDADLPDMDCAAAAEQIRAVRGGLCEVVAVSRPGPDGEEPLQGSPSISRIVHKPVFPSALLGAINDVIGTGTSRRAYLAEMLRRYGGRRVLVVDEAEAVREFVGRQLEPMGIEVCAAGSADEGVALYLEHEGAIDLILLDMRTPEADGCPAADRIRTSGLPGADTVPIIVMTEPAAQEEAGQPPGRGISGWVGKPLDEAKLYIELSRHMPSRPRFSAREEERAQDPSAPPPQEKAEGQYVDAEAGLRVLNNNLRLYQRLLKRFVERNGLEEAFGRLRDGDSAGAYNRLREMKGLADSLGLWVFAEMIEAFGEDFKSGALRPDSRRAEELRECWRRTVESIGALLADG